MNRIRWNRLEKAFLPSPKEIEDFLSDIEGVYKKHNLSISHEDGDGAFLIETLDDYNVRWLGGALDNRDE